MGSVKIYWTSVAKVAVYVIVVVVVVVVVIVVDVIVAIVDFFINLTTPVRLWTEEGKCNQKNVYGNTL